MASQSTPIRMPLLGIAGKVDQVQQVNDLPQGLKHISEVEISLTQKLPGSSYAQEVPNIFGNFPATVLGIFGFKKDVTALNDVYALGISGEEPCVCRVVKSDAKADSPDSNVKYRRNSFMTPTPLHIPESKVSPIPNSSHGMIYLKNLNDKEGLKVVPLKDVVWMHPLITVVENLHK